MKLSLHSKSFFNSNPNQSFNPYHQSPKQTRSLLQEIKQDSSRVEERSISYLKMFPENKRKNNVSLFNFFINKHPKRNKDYSQQTHNELNQSNNKFRQSKKLMQEESFIIKKVKGPFPSLSTEKLNMLPISSRQRLQKIVQNVEKIESKPSPQKQFTDRNFNKINENLSKNTKFDRKKYMYYRYRKKNSSQKNNTSFKETPQCNEIQRPRPSKTSFSQINMKTDVQAKSFEQNDGDCQGNEFKYNFYGVFPSKNKSFSQVKCKLTIQPVPRQASYKLIDRKSLSKTSRQMRQKKQPQQNSSKIFTQAIHFKSRKAIYPKHQSRENPQREKNQHKQEKILGWNLGEQLNIQQQYF